jgi:DNA replication and repair protein RecF
VEAGEAVAAHRARYIEPLRVAVAAMGERLLGITIELGLTQGWAAERTLQESLAASLERDRERGLTHSGPHRADLLVRVDGQPARDRVSRGQQKLVAAAMLLGQLQCDAEQGSGTTVLLVDDPAAELDSRSLDRLLVEVLKLPAQLFVTALDPANPALERLPGGPKFHVEHGSVTRLI